MLDYGRVIEMNFIEIYKVLKLIQENLNTLVTTEVIIMCMWRDFLGDSFSRWFYKPLTNGWFLMELCS